MSPVQLFRWSTLLGYFGLLATIALWNAWLSPPEHLPRSLVLLVLFLPLVFPLRGLLHGRAYTHAWSHFLSLGYFTLGVWHSAVASERAYGLAMAFTSLLFFIGTVGYARVRGRQLKTQAAADVKG